MLTNIPNKFRWSSYPHNQYLLIGHVKGEPGTETIVFGFDNEEDFLSKWKSISDKPYEIFDLYHFIDTKEKRMTTGYIEHDKVLDEIKLLFA